MIRNDFVDIHSETKDGLQTNISRISVSRILRYDLKMKGYAWRKVHYLNDRLRKLQYRKLLQRHDPKTILFTEDKIFTVEEKFNRHNDRVYGLRLRVYIYKQAIYTLRSTLKASYDGVTSSFLLTRC